MTDKLAEAQNTIENWQDDMMKRWGLDGKNYQFSPQNRPQPYQIKDMIISLLAAQDLISREEQKEKMVSRAVKMLKAEGQLTSEQIAAFKDIILLP